MSEGVGDGYGAGPAGRADERHRQGAGAADRATGWALLGLAEEEGSGSFTWVREAGGGEHRFFWAGG